MANAEAEAKFGALATYLDNIGLGQLFTVTDGKPGGWLWNKLQAGVDSEAELKIALEETDVFRDRFGVILEQQKRAKAGENVQVMSAAEVLAWEDKVTKTMHAAGLPSWFYDEPSDFNALILEGFSSDEIKARIEDAYTYVMESPPEVRQAFDDFYGAGQGEAALAAFALNPDITQAAIHKATRTAYAAGIGRRFDITIDKVTAERIADLPKSEAGIAEGIENVARLESVFNEGIGEAAVDLTNDTGIASEFDADAGASDQIQKRILERKAADRSSTGGALLTQAGLTGAGSS